MPLKQLTKRLETLIDEGSSQFLVGNYVEAEAVYRCGIDMAQLEVPALKPSLAKLLCLLGDLHDQLGEYPEAEAVYRQAIEIYDSLEVSDLVELSVTLRCLSNVCQKQKRIRNAAKASIRANKLIASSKEYLEACFLSS